MNDQHQHQQPTPAFASTGFASTGFASTGQALAAVRAGLAFLAGTDAAGLTCGEQADCLRGLAAAESVHLAAAANLLGAFDAAGGYCADGQAGAKAWLRWQTRITRPAAGAAVGWMRRLAAHPAVAAALGRAELSPSYARQICDWSDLLPEDARPGADEVLAAAAAAGLDLADLAVLAEQIRARTARPDTDAEADRFGKRRLCLARHYGGHGSLTGELTPPAADALEAVLAALGKRAGPEDLRTKDQRDHDALEDMCRQIIASGGLPEVAGQPVHIDLQMTLSQLIGQTIGDPALAEVIAGGGAPVPPGAGCDAAITPIVTGSIDHDLLDTLASRLLTRLDTGPGSTTNSPASSGEPATSGSGHQHGSTSGGPATSCSCDGPSGPGSDARGSDAHAIDHDLLDQLGGRLLTSHAGTVSGPVAASNSGGNSASHDGGCGCGDRGGRAIRAARQLTVAEAVRLLSGPGGLAAQLRTGVLAGPGATISLPLDIGRTTNIVPPHLRRAIARRDRHCRFPGCQRPVRACQVHHLLSWSEGGQTSLDNCCLLCPYHHLTVIHRQGWQLTLNPDGTTTAVDPGGHTLHSHAPPTAA